MIKIYRFREQYIGEQTAKGSSDKSFGLLRIPGFNGEAKEIGAFKRLNESYTQFIPLSEEFPAGFYPPEELFTNWEDFPELHDCKIMAWDDGGCPDIESQWVRFLLQDFQSANANA